MISTHAKDWFKDYMNVMAVVVYMTMGITGQNKQTIVLLLIYMFLGMVCKLSAPASLLLSMFLLIVGVNISS
jgi:hypothetical protein